MSRSLMDEQAFKSVEEKFFSLKGQLATGRITPEQFDAALQQLMIQDTQGRYWMLGKDSGKWQMNQGQSWVEADPYQSGATVAGLSVPPSAPLPVVASVPAVPVTHKTNRLPV